MQAAIADFTNIFSQFSTNLTNQARKAFETRLIETRNIAPDYPLAILQVMKNTEGQIQLRATIEFKIWCALYASQEEYESIKYAYNMENVKMQTLQLYLTSNDKCSKQLNEAIGSLCKKEYFQNWDNLVKDLIGVTSQNFEYLVRSLSIFKTITERYTYESRSDTLYSEIIFSCNQMHDFLLETCTSLIENLQRDQKSDYLRAMKEGLKLFYNLNYQDLHPKFQESIKTWMGILVQTIKLEGDVSNKELFKCKGAALKSIIMYSNNYREDIYDDTIQMFSVEVWNLFSNSSFRNNPDFSNLIVEGLKYFRFLISWSANKRLYAAHLSDLMNLLVLPNIGVTEDMKDDFNEDGDRYIQQYYHGGEALTKRALSIDLTRSMLKYYQPQFKTYLFGLLQNLTSKQMSLVEQSSLYHMIIDVASIAYRSTEGTSQLSIDESIITNCYSQFVLLKLSSIFQWMQANPNKEIESNFDTIYVASLLRYIFYFRVYIPKTDLPLLVKFCSLLISNHKTLRNVIYMTAEAFVTIRHGDLIHNKDLVHYFSPDNIGDLALDLLKMMYFNEQKETQLNYQLTTFFYNLMMTLKQLSVKFSEQISNILQSFLSKSDNYQFKSILPVFQGFGVFIYWMVNLNSDISQLETILNNYLTKSMAAGSDIINFILQIYALVLSTKHTVPDIYHNIYQSVIDVKNWDSNNTTLFSCYAFYISVYFQKYPEKIRENKKAIESIVSKLIQIKRPNIFFTLMLEIYNKFSLEEFFETGYLQMLLLGIQTMVLNFTDLKISILKEGLMVVSKIVMQNNTQLVIKLMNTTVPGFLDNIVVQGIHIIETITWRHERKPLIIAVSMLLAANCFNDINQIRAVINGLVNNTARSNRVRRERGPSYKNQLPTETIFKKLLIFKSIKNVNNEKVNNPMINENEEEVLVRCIKYLVEKYGYENIAMVLTEQNSKQLNWLVKKFERLPSVN